MDVTEPVYTVRKYKSLGKNKPWAVLKDGNKVRQAETQEKALQLVALLEQDREAELPSRARLVENEVFSLHDGPRVLDFSDYSIDRAQLLETLEQNKLPLEVCIMHTLVTDCPHHNSCTADWFIEKKLMPWVWQYTINCEDAVLLFKADNCHQFKSARVAHKVARWRESPVSKDTSFVQTNFEEKHGKDIVDPEQGRNKWLVFQQEMRSTIEAPTNMETSESAHKFLKGNCTKTQRTMEEKKGKGILVREYHYAARKDIPLLATTPEVHTLLNEEGKNCTEKSHLFYEDHDINNVRCREYACLTCEACMQLKFHQCALGWDKVGPIHRCKIRKVSGGLEYERVTNQAAREMAEQVAIGDILGSECTNTTEPYLISRALSALTPNPDGISCHWMGHIEAGTPYIKCKKYCKNSEFNYSEMVYEFLLPFDDLKLVLKKSNHITPARSSARAGARRHDIIELDENELTLLQLRSHSSSVASS